MKKNSSLLFVIIAKLFMVDMARIAPMKNMEDMIDMMDMGTTVDTIRHIITVAMTFTYNVVNFRTATTESYSFLIRETTTYVLINTKELFY